jgi:hypothetical protein
VITYDLGIFAFAVSEVTVRGWHNARIVFCCRYRPVPACTGLHRLHSAGFCRYRSVQAIDDQRYRSWFLTPVLAARLPHWLLQAAPTAGRTRCWLGSASAGAGRYRREPAGTGYLEPHTILYAGTRCSLAAPATAGRTRCSVGRASAGAGRTRYRPHPLQAAPVAGWAAHWVVQAGTGEYRRVLGVWNRIQSFTPALAARLPPPLLQAAAAAGRTRCRPHPLQAAPVAGWAAHRLVQAGTGVYRAFGTAYNPSRQHSLLACRPRCLSPPAQPLLVGNRTGWCRPVPACTSRYLSCQHSRRFPFLLSSI